MSTHKPITDLLEQIRFDNNKQVPVEFFNNAVTTKAVLKIIKNKLYQSEEWPHVDPTVGKSGYCQLIASLLGDQITKLNELDLENCDEEETRPLLPLVKAFILQEFHNPTNYQPLSPKSVQRRLKVDLALVHAESVLSNDKAKLLLKRTQASFMDDLFSFAGTTEFSDIEESMKVAMDIIHASDCFIHLRYYEGTPSRPDIFSSVGSPYAGSLYRRSAADQEKWEKISSFEQAQLVLENNQKNIIQVHFEYQPMIRGVFHNFALDQKPEIKRILYRNEKLNKINGTCDLFGFGDSVFDLREFVMRGVQAINDPELDFCDPLHPITLPCHFSVVPGMKNLCRILSLSTFFDEFEQQYNIVQTRTYRGDFSYAPLTIQRYISHWKNTSPDNPITWELCKRFKGIDVQLGLAYDEKNIISPMYSFIRIKENINGKAVQVRDRERVHQIYYELIDTVVRPLTNACYLYPQARFLLNQATITEVTIDKLLETEFINKLIDK